MSLSKLVLPADVRTVIDRLLAPIEAADSAKGVNMAAQRAEGFVLGLETVKAFQSPRISRMAAPWKTRRRWPTMPRPVPRSCTTGAATRSAWMRSSEYD
nr:hypothetical protein [Pseudomonas sp. RGB]